ncbi:hypothetical protein [Chromobacterium amazonense]|uniref:hypothetical protein n=1 Tax=Chromobacterium amazonense TaxID=1382803 RepID=UPI003F78BE12
MVTVYTYRVDLTLVDPRQDNCYLTVNNAIVTASQPIAAGVPIDRKLIRTVAAAMRRHSGIPVKSSGIEIEWIQFIGAAEVESF